MSLKVKFISVFLGLLTALTVINSCKNRQAISEIEISARTPVTVTQPVMKDIRETVEFPATSEFLIKNLIKSPITGDVEKVDVKQGDKINRGDLAFILRTREASAIQNKTGIDTTLGFTGEIKISSPKDGIVSTVSHQAGDFVQEGDELVMICDPKSLVFILEAPFEMTEYVEKNKTCPLVLPDNTVLTGTIRGKLPEMNAQNQTVSYIINPQTTEQLPENLIASAIITKKIDKDAVVIPRPALLGNETMNEFWIMKVINDSTAIKIPVTRGIENENEVEILEPKLLSSDLILLTGNYGLPDTASIIIEK
jgi:multidrug efflux pump subunit AcrA (membrane-fusion protein)